MGKLLFFSRDRKQQVRPNQQIKRQVEYVISLYSEGADTIDGIWLDTFVEDLLKLIRGSGIALESLPERCEDKLTIIGRVVALRRLRFKLNDFKKLSWAERQSAEGDYQRTLAERINAARSWGVDLKELEACYRLMEQIGLKEKDVAQ